LGKFESKKSIRQEQIIEFSIFFECKVTKKYLNTQI
jgi:hypothetical protein